MKAEIGRGSFRSTLYIAGFFARQLWPFVTNLTGMSRWHLGRRCSVRNQTSLQPTHCSPSLSRVFPPFSIVQLSQPSPFFCDWENKRYIKKKRKQVSNVSEEEDRGGRYVRLYRLCVFMKAEYSNEGE